MPDNPTRAPCLHRARIAALAAAAALTVAACNEEAAAPEQRIRAIKPYYVSELAGGDVRTFTGVVEAADQSALSFGVPGTVATVEVSPGDVVAEGDVLATLDPAPFRLDVDAAEAELARATADLNQSQAELARQRQLFDRGWVTRAALDQAVATAEAAESSLAVARSRLGSAERDLARTSLVAPFDGVIASRSVEPFTEVSGGQMVLELNSDAVLELALSVPSPLVGRMSVGLPILVDVATLPACGCDGRVTEIAAAAGSASAVDVTAILLDPPPGLLPGTAAEATVVLSNPDGNRGYLVPLEAIAAGDESAPAYVFKYDPQTGTVTRTPVAGQAGRDNLIELTEGVAAGDILAAAGVSFLQDGQQVRLPGD